MLPALCYCHHSRLIHVKVYLIALCSLYRSHQLTFTVADHILPHVMHNEHGCSLHFLQKEGLEGNCGIKEPPPFYSFDNLFTALISFAALLLCGWFQFCSGEQKTPFPALWSTLALSIVKSVRWWVEMASAFTVWAWLCLHMLWNWHAPGPASLHSGCDILLFLFFFLYFARWKLQ